MHASVLVPLWCPSARLCCPVDRNLTDGRSSPGRTLARSISSEHLARTETQKVEKKHHA
jgi:hypothetical protein